LVDSKFHEEKLKLTRLNHIGSNIFYYVQDILFAGKGNKNKYKFTQLWPVLLGSGKGLNI